MTNARPLRNLLAVDESTIDTLLRHPQIKAAFPCLANVKPMRAAGCGSCKRFQSHMIDRSGYDRAKRCLVESSAAQRQLLGNVLGARQIRLIVRQGASAARVTVQLLPKAS